MSTAFWVWWGILLLLPLAVLIPVVVVSGVWELGKWLLTRVIRSWAFKGK